MEVISPTITIKVTGHQWFWSIIHHSFNQGIELNLAVKFYLDDDHFSLI